MAVELWKKEVWPQVKHRGGSRCLDRLRGRGRTVDDAAACQNLGPPPAHAGCPVCAAGAPDGSRWPAWPATDRANGPGRLTPSASTGAAVAAWLAERRGIEVVCRDRAPFFAEGASIGAPTAVQVAVRFHLWRNLGEAAERYVSRHRSRHRSCLRETFAESAPEKVPAPTPAENGSPWPTGHRFADRTRANYAAVHALPATADARSSDSLA
ncbi:transposase [Streptomyces gardneri]|nr:transposase [Streptomyces gardneri]CUM43805.1 Transposase [Streptomyces venezuelae]